MLPKLPSLQGWVRRAGLAVAVIAAGTFAAPAAFAANEEYLTVGDAIEQELRVLDVLGPPPGSRLRMPRLHTRPLQRFELDSLPHPNDVEDFARRVSLTRVWRVLARDFGTPEGLTGVTPRLFQHAYSEDVSFEASVGFEGRGELANDRVRYVPDTGVHMRFALMAERWLAYTDLVAGYQDSVKAFADPIFLDSDVTTLTPESYLAYTGVGRRWGFQLGRSRWHWGPGDEGSLLLSRTSAPFTGVALHVRVEPLRADVTTLSATLRSAGGEQLAAHRIEWQLAPSLRLGLAEAARYQSASWQPLYLVGIIPYQLVQRLQFQDEPGVQANRNNVMVGADASWRIAPGTRVYGELLADDVHTIRRVSVPNKYAYQIGWEGAGPMMGGRVTWSGEYTRVTRFVYTSFFGRDFVAQGRSLGFPWAPDARRIRLRVNWDPSTDWQLLAIAAETKRGENTLAEPYVSGHVDADTFQGVVETTREFEAGVRWWPAGGVDLEASLGHRTIENALHVDGFDDDEMFARFALRLVR